MNKLEIEILECLRNKKSLNDLKNENGFNKCLNELEKLGYVWTAKPKPDGDQYEFYEITEFGLIYLRDQ